MGTLSAHRTIRNIVFGASVCFVLCCIRAWVFLTRHMTKPHSTHDVTHCVTRDTTHDTARDMIHDTTHDSSTATHPNAQPNPNTHTKHPTINAILQPTRVTPNTTTEHPPRHGATPNQPDMTCDRTREVTPCVTRDTWHDT